MEERVGMEREVCTHENAVDVLSFTEDYGMSLKVI
jgi:hypothetical protein